MADNPYKSYERKAFWAQAVAQSAPHALSGVYDPKFEIRATDRIATAGSCFAQHIGRALRAQGFAVLDKEPAPPFMPPDAKGKFGFGLYSARYGNIYTARQLRQTIERAEGAFRPLDEAWSDGERCFDPFRPNIEPEGFAGLEALRADRAHHLRMVAELVAEADLFIFTFGLTEAWRDRRDGAVYPTCPGTVAGEFDETRHEFVNFGFMEVLEDFERFREMAKRANPDMRFLVTVSPVPLTATASGDHVLPATVYSKSVLRAVCGELRARHDDVDYFPSYELIASHPMRGMWFEANLRSVSNVGVEQVMKTFVAAMNLNGEEAPQTAPAAPAPAREPHPDDLVCEEELLAGFAK